VYPELVTDDMSDRQMRQTEGNFLEALFDFSFSEFVTVHLVRILYILALIVAIIGAATTVISLFSISFLAGLFSILLAPLTFLIIMVVARVFLEMMVVIFRIADYLREIAAQGK
jgi:hypothetical protein